MFGIPDGRKRKSKSESIPATEITEITEAQVLSHLKATQVK